MNICKKYNLRQLLYYVTFYVLKNRQKTRIFICIYLYLVVYEHIPLWKHKKIKLVVSYLMIEVGTKERDKKEI